MFTSKYKLLCEELDEQVHQQASVLKAIDRSMAVIEFTPKGEVITANENFLSTVGYTLGEIKGEHHQIFCEDEYSDSKKYHDFWRQLNKGEFMSGQFKRKNKNGEIIWLEATYNPVLDEKRNVTKVVKFASDITQKKIEGANNLGKLDALSRSSAIIEFELNGTIIDCNQNFLETVGYAKEELVGNHHRIFCEREYTEGNEYGDFWAALNRGEFCSGQFKRLNKLGQVLWLEASYNPVYDSEGNLYRVVKFASNITEQTERASQERENVGIAYRISNETLGVAREGGGVINDAVAEMNKISESLNDSSHHIQSLNQQSGQISSIINTIQEIADQTNLLALNAAIEAARAGDQGRGFAVVADEVRQLAARTSQSTSEISTMINNIQEETGNASSSMEKCLGQAERGVDLANQTGEVIAKIQTGATEVVTAIDSLSNNLAAP